MAKRRKGGGKAAAAGDRDAQDVDDELGAEAPPEISTKGIPVTRACQIADTGQRIAAEIAFLLRREEKTVKVLTKIREDRKSKTRDLINLWGDEAVGQTHLDLDPKTDAAPAKPVLVGPGSDHGAGKTDAAAFVSGYGERVMAVKMVGAGEWAGFVDGVQIEGRDRTAQEAMDRVLEHLMIPSKRWSTWVWEGVMPEAPKEGAWTAEYKGRRLTVEAGKDGLFRAICKTGAAVAATSKETFEDPTDAMEKALTMAGYDERDERPKWERTGASTVERVLVAEVAGKKLRVTQRGTDIRATVDGNYGGEHSSVEAAQVWAVTKALGHAPKRAEKPAWTEKQDQLEGATGAPVAEKPGQVYKALLSDDVDCELRHIGNGAWDGRVLGKPIATAQPRDVAERLINEYLRKEFEIDPVDPKAWKPVKK